MNQTLDAIEHALAERLENRRIPRAAEIAWACAWLEGCGYPGLSMLAEALDDERREIELARDAIGLDLANVSCAFLAPQIMADVEAHGRAFLRNVRHGLFLLPFTVLTNVGIGCPVDRAFAVGGVRTKNPYEEKLAIVRDNGVEIDDALWRRLCT
ncbi:MAG: hypothetical protein HYX36_07270 [Rhizobiales bacterium]|nr:hypothetical protein [Hyphomicrobiales bacterium]